MTKRVPAYDAVPVRIAGDLYRRLAEQAKANHRTVRGQIEFILELSQSTNPAWSSKQLETRGVSRG